MEDAAKFDAELATPLPGSNRRRATTRQSPDEARSATNDFMQFAAWAQAAKTGGGR